jgi:hypothetical protein
MLVGKEKGRMGTVRKVDRSGDVWVDFGKGEAYVSRDSLGKIASFENGVVSDSFGHESHFGVNALQWSGRLPVLNVTGV